MAGEANSSNDASWDLGDPIWILGAALGFPVQGAATGAQKCPGLIKGLGEVKSDFFLRKGKNKKGFFKGKAKNKRDFFKERKKKRIFFKERQKKKKDIYIYFYFFFKERQKTGFKCCLHI